MSQAYTGRPGVPLLVAGLLLVGPLALYAWPILQAGPLAGLDPPVFDQPLPRLDESWAQPLVVASWQADGLIDMPGGGRWLSALLVGLAAVALAWSAWLMLDQAAPHESTRRRAAGLAATTAALWCVHPLVSEAVFAQAARGGLLLALASFAAVGGLLQSRTARWPSAWLLLSLLAVAVGLASSTAGLLLPLALALVAWTVPRPANRPAGGASSASYWLVMVILALGTAAASATVAIPREPPFAFGTLTTWEFLAHQPDVWLQSIGQTFWPQHLMAMDRSPLGAPSGGFLGLGVVAVLAILTMLVAVRGKSLTALALALGLLFAAGTAVVPAHPLEPACWQLVSEPRWLVPLALLLAVSIALADRWLIQALPAGGLRQGLTLLIVVGLVGGLAVRSWDRAQDWIEPERFWTQALAIQPQNAASHYGLARALWDATADDPDGRIAQHLDEALSLWPRSAQAWALWAIIEARQGDRQAAVLALRTALRLDPTSPEIRLELGRALVGFERMREAEDHIRRAIQARPTPESHALLGWLLLEASRPGEAAEAFEAALALDPRARQRAALGLGTAKLATGQLDEAEPHLRAAVAQEPNSAEAHYRLAALLVLRDRDEQDLADAQTHLQAALEANPRHADARAFWGNRLMLAGRPAEAAEQFAIAVAELPENPALLYNLAMARLAAGQAAEAVEPLRTLVEESPEWLEPAVDLGWVWAAWHEPTVRDTSAALALTERLMSGPHADSARVLDVRAAALADAGRFDEAERLAQQAINAAINAGDEDHALDIQDRLRRYEIGQAYRIR